MGSSRLRCRGGVSILLGLNIANLERNPNTQSCDASKSRIASIHMRYNQITIKTVGECNAVRYTRHARLVQEDVNSYRKYGLPIAGSTGVYI
jgi:hypothetical protein